MTTTTKNQKLVSLRASDEIVNFLKKESKKDGRSVSNYLRWLVLQQMDETDYLLANPNNKKMLLKSINEANKLKYIKKSLITD
jgi:predicted DNA-binding protein